MKHCIVFFVLNCLSFLLVAQNGVIKGTVLDKKNDTPLPNVEILLQTHTDIVETNESGEFEFRGLKAGKYQLIFYTEGYSTTTQVVHVATDQTTALSVTLGALEKTFNAVEVEAQIREDYGLRRLNNVEGIAIYAAKKSEVIQLRNITANLATNNPRQVYKGIAGLNIWESDGAGLQLSIGARGLDPNRTSNFNTRQNGYDISADALGYPESYYTPPTQALERIEIVRGAASLQYGPQFGGLLNFVFKKGNRDTAFEFITENTVGSFGLINSFNSIGGEKNGLNYYGFYQRKQGNGWRPNSQFEQNTGYVRLEKDLSKKFKVGLEYTHMDYLAQQAGGLQDFEFEQNPRQSKRARNWFKVNWNLAALKLDYRLNDKTKINSRSFFLSAQRQSLGELGAINRPDPLRERDLIKGAYRNFGNETRLIHRYEIQDQLATFLIGGRYYQGYTQSQQGDASDEADANFTFLNPNDLEKSNYEFPSRNLSLFAENLFYINEKWSITPGIRFEYIRTASDGYYKERIFSGGQLLFEQKFTNAKENSRALMLAGLGIGHKIKDDIEAYANFSQNYRSINFSDLAVVNPNLIVDSLLKDEKGFNFDLGIRGSLFNDAIRFDGSLFYLSYQDRIGVGEIVVPDPAVIEKAVAYRTNIGDARIVGLEAYMEADLWRLITKTTNDTQPTDMDITLFANFSALHGEYLSGNSAIVGNQVELIPPFSLKTGLNFRWKTFTFAYQYAYTQQHYTDATNATFVVDATRGLIPSYSVQDIALSYTYHRYRLQTGVNNLMNHAYFTRRATAYPGPGIIPSDGRNFYLTLRVRL